MHASAYKYVKRVRGLKCISGAALHNIKHKKLKIGVYAYFAMAEELDLKHINEELVILKELCAIHIAEIRRYAFRTHANQYSCTKLCYHLNHGAGRHGFPLKTLELLMAALTKLSGHEFNLLYPSNT